jgi:valyl-tRNA synthetase
MSKSLGNGIDPLEVIEKYGADALRFTLATGNSPGNDMRYNQERVEASRNFANKLWNASRFILMNIGEEEVKNELPNKLETEDKWVISKFNALCRDVTDNLEKFELGMAVQKLYDFIWDIFCDWYIELAKTRLQAGGETSENVKQVLVWVMSNTLKLLHPFMPFITEEIWQSLPHEGETIMISSWPEYDEKLSFLSEETEMERIMAAIRAIRNRRAEMNVPPSKKTHVYIETSFIDTFTNGIRFIERLAFASAVEIGTTFSIPDSVQIVGEGARIYIPMGELVDYDKEIARLEKEKDASFKSLTQLEIKLSNEGFVSKAPPAVVAAERDKVIKLKEKIALIDQSLNTFKK